MTWRRYWLPEGGRTGRATSRGRVAPMARTPRGDVPGPPILLRSQLTYA